MGLAKKKPLALTKNGLAEYQAKFPIGGIDPETDL
jgi:hypothetical protein